MGEEYYYISYTGGNSNDEEELGLGPGEKLGLGSEEELELGAEESGLGVEE